eukprot:scaffold64146_cov35-Tisochrysis_lutea.AAC.2
MNQPWERSKGSIVAALASDIGHKRTPGIYTLAYVQAPYAACRTVSSGRRGSPWRECSPLMVRGRTAQS